MVSSVLQASVKNLKDIHKAYLHKHKELFSILKEIEIKSICTNFPEDPSKPSINDPSTFQKIQKLAGQLLDLDQKSIKTLQVLQEKTSWLEKVKKRLKIVKHLLSETEVIVIKELKSFDNYFKEASSSLIQQKSKNSPILVEKFKEDIKTILKTLVHPDTIQQFSTNLQVPQHIYLLKSFYLDVKTEEPELEQNFDVDTKKILNHMAYLLKTVEKLSESLLKVLRQLCVKQESPQIEELNNMISVTPSQLKALKLKINRLHNRGSLTDEEARNMLGKISVLTVSPENQTLNVAGKDQFGSTDVVEVVEDFINMTFDKSKSPLGHSFSRDLNKRIKQVKRISKRTSTPAKRIVRNTSLPKAVIYNKFSNEKVKQLKIKSKSPHSFL